MSKISKEALESLARIGYQERALVEYLTVERAELVSKLEFEVNDVQMRVLQGRSQQLSELLALIKQAPELCRKA